MDSHIIYLKNRFYKLDTLSGSTFQSSELWSDALVYNSQNNQWLHPNTAVASRKIIHDLNEKKWIRLVKLKGSDKSEFHQQGPFSDHEIFDMLKKSQVSFKDPLWKKGLSRWTPISRIETFKGLQEIQEQNYSSATTADLLDSVIEMRRVESETQFPESFIENEVPVDENLNLEKFEKSEDNSIHATTSLPLEDHQRKNNHSIVFKSDAKTFPIERLLFALGVTILVIFGMIKIMF